MGTCAAGNPQMCTSCDGSFLENGECKDCLQDSHCDDSKFCTVDICISNQCKNKPLSCDDKDPSTLDSCSEFSKSCVNSRVRPCGKHKRKYFLSPFFNNYC